MKYNLNNNLLAGDLVVINQPFKLIQVPGMPAFCRLPRLIIKQNMGSVLKVGILIIKQNTRSVPFFLFIYITSISRCFTSLLVMTFYLFIYLAVL